MTAEVAVLNRIGVALASDSAVTIGSKATKIYTSADKLFQLANEAPVGAMVYGNAALSGMPWETIIKTYRNKLHNSKFGTIAEYAKDILSYLTHNTELFPEKLQNQSLHELLYSFFLDLQQTLKKRFAEEAKAKGGLTDDDLPSIIEDVIEKRRNRVMASDGIADFPADTKDRLRAAFSDEIVKLHHKTLGNLPISDGLIAKLHEMVIEILVRSFFGPYKCGLVIAGFGEKQFAPALIAIDLEGIVLGLVRQKTFETFEVSEESDACILPFAQSDQVMHFLEGIDQSTERFLHKTTGTVVNGAVDLLLQKLAATDPELAEQLRVAVKPEIGSLLEKLFEGWSKHKQQNWAPIVNMVSALPKDELGAMSEALVNLTKFRRRITPERETVGGPIDVAVITKGDGFVWLKRKHYFDPALNPRVMARYGKEIT